ncbi:hypothetical protein SELMODRAFT_418401 [Selaginella moellendorffii]|uniref:Protein kinase domain-containing protein n=1 Tax=Selaginella moellendorffii TaxID=88036 RepID=D8S5L0_SELML|nr:hypothetical protein SELMODRAFT_418401 [Selaginella moellendorffii]
MEWIYLTAKPGVFLGAVDAYFLVPVHGSSSGARSQEKRFRRGSEAGRGIVWHSLRWSNSSQGFPARARDWKALAAARGVPGVPESHTQEGEDGRRGSARERRAERWRNGLTIAWLALPWTCARRSFVADSTRGRFVEGGKWLVWKYEGDSTLADFMKDRRFPKNLAEPLLGRSREKDPLKRKALTIRRILREILATLKKMHATGIVHRDVRPANLVVTNKAELKNYVPERGMLDPDHFPPELFVMPEETPRPPPAPIALQSSGMWISHGLWYIQLIGTQTGHLLVLVIDAEITPGEPFNRLNRAGH